MRFVTIRPGHPLDINRQTHLTIARLCYKSAAVSGLMTWIGLNETGVSSAKLGGNILIHFLSVYGSSLRCSFQVFYMASKDFIKVRKFYSKSFEKLKRLFQWICIDRPRHIVNYFCWRANRKCKYTSFVKLEIIFHLLFFRRKNHL